MSKVRRWRGNVNAGLTYWCPGCLEYHSVVTEAAAGPVWEFNGDVERPTIAPSVRVRWGVSVCHHFVREGVLEFLGDCTHALAGVRVPMKTHFQEEEE